MIFPVIRYHLEHGCESFSNQEDLDWAYGHGWVDGIPEGYDKGFEPSRIPNSLVMVKLRALGDKPIKDKETIGIPVYTPENSKKKKKYLSQMNLTELRNESINRGIAPRGMTRKKIREAIRAYDNRTDTNN